MKIYDFEINEIPVIAFDLEDWSNCFRYNICWNYGSKYENESNRGITHFIEHLSFLNTPNYNNALNIDFGDINAFTTMDKVVYYIQSLSEKAEEVIKCVTEVAFNDCKNIPDDIFNAEKMVIKNEIDTSDNRVETTVNYGKYLSVGLGEDVSILGNTENIDNIKKSDIIKYVQKFKFNKNLYDIIVIFDSCSISIEKIKSLMEKELNKISFLKHIPYLVLTTDIDKIYLIENECMDKSFSVAKYFPIKSKDYHLYKLYEEIFYNKLLLAYRNKGLCYASYFYSQRILKDFPYMIFDIRSGNEHLDKINEIDDIFNNTINQEISIKDFENAIFNYKLLISNTSLRNDVIVENIFILKKHFPEQYKKLIEIYNSSYTFYKNEWLKNVKFSDIVNLHNKFLKIEPVNVVTKRKGNSYEKIS